MANVNHQPNTILQITNAITRLTFKDANFWVEGFDLRGEGRRRRSGQRILLPLQNDPSPMTTC
jgi:hypothetical protein